ncbi:MAG: hypothetical protein IJL22_06945 [Bacteroidales bacterium]|nr:hypothetical protein [Bacteroidales bacterium]
MIKKTNILVVLSLFVAFAGCTKPERFPQTYEGSGNQQIRFSAEAHWTKADVTLNDLKADDNGWGVFAYYTGTDDYSKPEDAQGVIFNKRRVKWATSGENMNSWDYSIDAAHKKEYWPMDPAEKVTFFAFAPWKEFNSAVSVDNEGPYVTYTASTNLAQQKDLLWGTNTSGLPHRNVNMATYPDSIVDMHFRHAPAKIHFTINGASLDDETAAPTPQGNATTNTTYSSNNDINKTQEATGSTYNYYTLYWAYRVKTVTTTQTYRQLISGFKILINSVEMKNFIKDGVLHLNNPDSYVPYWTNEASQAEDFLTYNFTASDIVTAVANPGNQTTLSNGWGTTYLGVNSDPKELLPAPNNYIYMIPKEADDLVGDESNNIKISVRYHVIGLTKTVQFTRTTTTVSYQRVPYYRSGNSYYYKRTNGNYTTDLTRTLDWADVNNNANYPVNTSYTDGTSTNVGNPEWNYSQDNDGDGFLAVGPIASDILGGRDYTINLYLDGRELKLQVIPQPWDLQETTYDYNSFINPVQQSLTYDSDFVYEVIGSNVYINNRMGKFYFKLGSGMYLYWQASLIGDDAFAFTDENGEYLLDDNGDYRTTVRGDIGENMNYIYVKAINTSSHVTSKAKLRIYLFNSENRATVALPQDNWPFVSSSYINGQGQQVRVMEWNVVQTAN